MGEVKQVADIYADVIIVGAGPAGLATANYLGMQGVRTILVERNSGTVQEPRAVSIDDETMRGLQMIGLVDRLIPRTLPGYGARYYSPNQKEFARIKPTTLEFGHPRRSAFHQPEFEALLLEGLKRFLSVEVMFESTFESFEQDTNGVTVTIRDRENAKKHCAVRFWPPAMAANQPSAGPLGRSWQAPASKNAGWFLTQ